MRRSQGQADRARRAACAFALGFVAATAGASAETAGDPTLVAERIVAGHFDRLRVGGPDADAGIGDWALQNGTLCAAVSAGEHESPLSPHGGVLIDLGHCGRADDQWSTLQPLLNLDQGSGVPVRAIRGEVDAAEARVIVTGGSDAVRVETTYTLSLAVPEVLAVRTEVSREAGGGWAFAFGDVVLHPSGQLRPFAMTRRDLEGSPGFAHPSGKVDSPLAMLEAMTTADLHVLVGGEAFSGIAYGLDQRGAYLRRADGSTSPVSGFANTGESHTLVGVAAGPYFLGGEGAPGLLELAQLPLLDLSAGETLVFERAIRVGRRADVASITDAVFADGGRVSGTAPPEARIHVSTAAGAPVTEVRPDENGRYAFRVPSGFYRLRAVAPWGEAEQEVAVSAPAPMRASSRFPGPATWRFRPARPCGWCSGARAALRTRVSVTTCWAFGWETARSPRVCWWMQFRWREPPSIPPT